MVWQRTDGKGLKFSPRPILFTHDLNISTGNEVRTLIGHSRNVTGILHHPTNNSQILTCSSDGTIIRWNYIDCEILEKININFPISYMVQHPEKPSILFLLCEDSQSEDNQFRQSTQSLLEYSLENRKKVKLLSKLVNCNGIAIDSTGKNVAAIHNNVLFSVNTQTHRYIRYEHLIELTTVVFNPREGSILTGDTSGKIITWYFQNDSKMNQVVTKEVHWHSHAVKSLCFSVDGSYLLSGGQEGVLVIWQVETGTKQFLPRLGASISSITASSDGRIYALLLEDNSVRLVNSLSLSVQSVIQGLKRDESQKYIFSKIVCDPRSNLIVMNGLSNTLQFYNPFTDNFMYELEVAPRNLVNTPNSEFSLPKRHVEFFCFSFDGVGLVTIDSTKFSNKKIYEYSESSLKFWTYDETSHHYLLTTRVEKPHKGQIIDLIYHPSLHLVASAGTDGKFKIWIRSKVNESEASWYCRSVGNFKKSLSLHSMAFSPDGSILAVAYDNIITLWNPFSNVLQYQLSNLPFAEAIKKLIFVPNTAILIAYSGIRLSLWNLLSCSVMWSYSSDDIGDVIADPDGGRFIVVSRSENCGYLVLFEVTNPKPIQCWKFKSPTFSATFLSTQFRKFHKSPAQSSIVYVTKKPEIHLLEEWEIMNEIENPTSNNPNVETNEDPSKFESFFGDNSTQKNIVSSEEEIQIHNPSNKHHHLFDAPSHVLPPLNTLYKSFMNTLLIKEDDTKQNLVAVIDTMDIVPSNNKEKKEKQKEVEEQLPISDNGEDVFTATYDNFFQFFQSELQFVEIPQQKKSKKNLRASMNGASPETRKQKKAKTKNEEEKSDDQVPIENNSPKKKTKNLKEEKLSNDDGMEIENNNVPPNSLNGTSNNKSDSRTTPTKQKTPKKKSLKRKMENGEKDEIISD